MLIRIDRDMHGCCSSSEEEAPSNSCFWHHRYQLNPEERKNNKLSPAEFLLDLYGLEEPEDFEDCREAFEELLEKDLENGFVVRKVYMYDHSGITISMSTFACRWDSSTIGIIWFPREDLQYYLSEEERDELPEGKEFPVEYVGLAVEKMQSQVKCYDAYLRGEEYFFTLDDGDDEDSCHGFICPECPDTVEGIEASGMPDHWPNDWKERARVVYVPTETVILEGPPEDLFLKDIEISVLGPKDSKELSGYAVMRNDTVLSWHSREADAEAELRRLKKKRYLK